MNLWVAIFANLTTTKNTSARCITKMKSLDRKEILDELIAVAKEKGYSEYAYAFGVISTYLTDENLKDLKRFVKNEKKDLEKGKN
jgi:cytochrome c553